MDDELIRTALLACVFEMTALAAGVACTSCSLRPALTLAIASEAALSSLEAPGWLTGATGGASPSSTQVSLLPPPCELLTTSEPRVRATRVRPPGMMVTSLPTRMYGRRSTWAGSIWPLSG